MEVKKIREFLLWSFFLFLPTQLGYHFWPKEAYVWGLRLDFLSPTIYLTDLLILALVLFSWPLFEKWLKKEWKNKTKILGLGLVLAFLVLNIIFSSRPLVSFYRFLRLGEFFFLVFFLKRFRFSLWPQALLLGNLVSSFLAWGQVFKGSSWGGIFWWLGERSFNLATPGIALAQVGNHLLLRPYATFSHPNSLAGFLLVSLLLLRGARESFKNKTFFRLALLFLGLTLFLSFSFAAYLGAGLALIIFLGKKWWEKSGLLPKIGIGVMLLLYIIAILLSIEAGLVEQKSLNERLVLAQNALTLIKKRSLLGVGLGNFIPAQAEMLPFLRQDVNLLQPVHNIYLLIAAETGLIGLLVFVAMMVKAFLGVCNTFLHHRAYAIRPYILVLFLGLFDHYWLTLPQNFLLFAVVLGFINTGKNGILE